MGQSREIVHLTVQAYEVAGEAHGTLPRIVPAAVREARVAASLTACEYGRSVEAKVLQIAAEIRRRYGSAR